MTRRTLTTFGGVIAASALTLAALAAQARAQAIPGEPAPAFTGQTAAGETLSLAELSGRTVVLEWTNHGCPYVARHYGGAMQALQADAAADGVVWVQVISSAPGEQGHVDASTAMALNEERGAAPAHTILDPEGTIGRAYDARTTPHMYVIDANGVLQYAGGVDDQPRPREGDPAPTPYVAMALEAVAKGETPDPAATQPYGCSVKYG
ncbi:alkyl hydroperoxide reductase [Leptolyngbya valderiana BDU 20041]|nr:alkyl hydroperoxide reductase [Leptolyngbya valderiana BDU 20041]